VLKGPVARRYAEAVFEIGVQQETIDRWHDDLGALAEYLGNRRLAFILKEPKIPYTRKEAIVRDLLSSKVQPEALNLGLLLVERGLAELAPTIRDHFETLYDDYRGQAHAQIITAIPLDDTLRAQITSELSQLTGKRILLQEKVDPSILGGAIARVGDTLIDGSLKRRFQLLRQTILQGGLGGPSDGGDGGNGNQQGAVPPPDGGSPAGGAASPADGPATATQQRPRSPDAPHLAPRQQPPQSRTPNTPNRNAPNTKRRKR
jgi:F-type H+-transporting ATPase subunit delta